MSRPSYGSHSGSRHACQKRPTSQCGWTRRAAAQTVVAQRVLGGARKALLRDRGNESLRRRLSEGAPPRGAHAGDGFIVGGSCSRADARLGSALLVVKSGGKEVSHIEKNSDLVQNRYVATVTTAALTIALTLALTTALTVPHPPRNLDSKSTTYPSLSVPEPPESRLELQGRSGCRGLVSSCL